MSYPYNIVLIGLMWACKTTVGKLLAKHLDKTFLDSDHEIERRTGVTIPLIFELEGEAGFRDRETHAISELSQLENVVLATGGGAVLREENRCNLRSCGMVVYLRAQVRDLWLRTRRDKNRPLLQTGDPRRKLQELFSQQDPIYRQLADIVIDTGDQNVHSLVRQLEQKLKNADLVR
jgi:shikimate kinase